MQTPTIPYDTTYPSLTESEIGATKHLTKDLEPLLEPTPVYTSDLNASTRRYLPSLAFEDIPTGTPNGTTRSMLTHARYAPAETTARPHLHPKEEALLAHTIQTYTPAVLQHIFGIHPKDTNAAGYHAEIIKATQFPFVVITDTSRMWTEEEEARIYDYDETFRQPSSDSLTQKDLARRAFYQEQAQTDVNIFQKYRKLLVGLCTQHNTRENPAKTQQGTTPSTGVHKVGPAGSPGNQKVTIDNQNATIENGMPLGGLGVSLDALGTPLGTTLSSVVFNTTKNHNGAIGYKLFRNTFNAVKVPTIQATETIMHAKRAAVVELTTGYTPQVPLKAPPYGIQIVHNNLLKYNYHYVPYTFRPTLGYTYGKRSKAANLARKERLVPAPSNYNHTTSVYANTFANLVADYAYNTFGDWRHDRDSVWEHLPQDQKIPPMSIEQFFLKANILAEAHLPTLLHSMLPSMRHELQPPTTAMGTTDMLTIPKKHPPWLSPDVHEIPIRWWFDFSTLYAYTNTTWKFMPTKLNATQVDTLRNRRSITDAVYGLPVVPHFTRPYIYERAHGAPIKDTQGRFRYKFPENLQRTFSRAKPSGNQDSPIENGMPLGTTPLPMVAAPDAPQLFHVGVVCTVCNAFLSPHTTTQCDHLHLQIHQHKCIQQYRTQYNPCNPLKSKGPSARKASSIVYTIFTDDHMEATSRIKWYVYTPAPEQHTNVKDNVLYATEVNPLHMQLPVHATPQEPLGMPSRKRGRIM